MCNDSSYFLVDVCEVYIVYGLCCGVHRSERVNTGLGSAGLDFNCDSLWEVRKKLVKGSAKLNLHRATLYPKLASIGKSFVYNCFPCLSFSSLSFCIYFFRCDFVFICLSCLLFILFIYFMGKCSWKVLLFGYVMVLFVCLFVRECSLYFPEYCMWVFCFLIIVVYLFIFIFSLSFRLYFIWCVIQFLCYCFYS